MYGTVYYIHNYPLGGDGGGIWRGSITNDMYSPTAAITVKLQFKTENERKKERKGGGSGT